MKAGQKTFTKTNRLPLDDILKNQINENQIKMKFGINKYAVGSIVSYINFDFYKSNLSKLVKGITREQGVANAIAHIVSHPLQGPLRSCWYSLALIFMCCLLYDLCFNDQRFLICLVIHLLISTNHCQVPIAEMHVSLTSRQFMCQMCILLVLLPGGCAGG